MARTVTLDDEGVLQLKENRANGTSSVNVKAPASLSGNVPLVLLAANPATNPQLLVINSSGVLSLIADGSASEVLTTDGAGGYSFAAAAGSGSLDDAYNNGSTITVDTGAVALTVSSGVVGLTVTNSAGGASAVATFSGVGTGDVVSIDQTTGAGIALDVTSDVANIGVRLTYSGTSHGIQVVDTSAGAGASFRGERSAGSGPIFSGVGSGTHSAALFFGTQATNAPCLSLTNSNNLGTVASFTKSGTSSGGLVAMTNAGTGTGLTVTQNGAATAVFIDGNSTGVGMRLDSAGAVNPCLQMNSSGAGIGLDLNKTGAGTAIDVNQSANAAVMNLVATTAMNTGFMVIDKQGTAGGIVVDITNDGTGTALVVRQDGEAVGLFVDKDSTGAAIAVRIDNAGTGEGLKINQAGSGTGINVDYSSSSAGTVAQFQRTGTGTGVTVQIDSATASSGAVLQVNQTNGTFAGDVVQILHAGAGLYIDTDAGAGTPANLTNAGVWTDATCFRNLKKIMRSVDLDDVLEKIAGAEYAWYQHKSDHERGVENPRTYLGSFQETLTAIGCRDDGTSAREIAWAVGAAVKALCRRVVQLEERLQEVAV